MDPQNGSQGGGQRYCPTPIMAPPSSSPAPPMQHVPQPSLSPSPHLHSGYYSHGGGYPTPQSQQQSYYQNYSYQGHTQAPAPQATHYSHQHQQWGHHSYYQSQQSVEVGSSTHPQQQQQSPYQTDAYSHPPQAQSPYPPYVQHQHQQQRMHPAVLPPQQQQPQHALMNLSRFVSQQSPPSPVPSMPHSPTTPVPIPMGSPHYHQQQPAIPGHLTPQPQPLQQSMYPQSQTPQGHMSLPPNQSNLQHSTSPYHSPTIPIHSQNSKNSESQRIQQQIMPNVTPGMSKTANSTPNNHTNAIMTSSSEQVQNPSNDNSINSANHHMALFSNGGRSESTSPSSSVSSSRALLSPPPTPGVVSSASSNGHHMIPVRLQNMQSGARTKASMRKMMQMQEQQVSTVVGGSGSMGSGTEDSNNPSFSDPELSTGKKSTASKKTPKKSKKGALTNNDNDIIPTTIRAATDSIGGDESVVPMNDTFPTIAVASASTISQTRRGGRKAGKSPKTKKATSTKGSPTKKLTPTLTKRGRHRSSMSSNPENPELTLESQLSTPPRAATKTQMKNLDKNKSSPAELKDDELLPDEHEGQEEHQKKKPKVTRGKSTIGKKKASLSPYSKAKGRTTKISMAKKKQKKSPSKVDLEPESPDFPDALLLQLEAEINAIPIRPIRMRAAKEQTKKPEEAKVEDRSRSTTSRSKRGSVSYKEMSTSRSKSPKEITSPPLRPASTSSTKKSPSPSPAKKPSASPKEKIKLVKVKVPKASPRSPRKVKETSPSPTRSSLLKEKSPLNRRESSRASKESVAEEETIETPKRAPRKAKEKPVSESSAVTAVEPDVKTPPSPKKVTNNKKSKRDTPVRMPSPRLAKEKSITPGIPSKSTSLDLSEEQVEQVQPKSGTPRRKAKPMAKGKIPKKGKTLVAATSTTATGRKRKISNPVNLKLETINDTAVANEELSEPTIKKAKVTKKRGGARQRTKIKAPKSSKLKSSTGSKKHDIEGEFETEVREGLHDADTTLVLDSTDGNDISLGVQSQPEMETGSSLEMISSFSTSDFADNNTKASSTPFTTPASAVPRRRSKSSRQSVDVSPVVPIASLKSGPAKVTGSQGAELNLILTPLPPTPKENVGQRMETESLLNTPSSVASNLQLLSDSVNSIISSTNVTPGKATKPKTPRKPRPPKVKKVAATTASESAIMNQSLILDEIPPVETPTGDQPKTEKKKKKKQTKHELKQLEFQQRKAYLEVEVAQALLDMKHNSSNSSSPSKVTDSALTPTTSTQVQQNSTLDDSLDMKKPTKPRKSPAKPRKRKNTSDTQELKIDQSGGERPSTPLTSPIQPTSSNLSPDIATPLSSKAKKGIKQPRKPKKPRLDISGQPPLTSTPTILAVPQINGNQGLNFLSNNSISFQNTPKQSGPVKVSKTVMLGMGEPKSSTIADIESTIASVSSGFITPFADTSEITGSNQKPKAKPRPRKKNVVTKILSVTSDPAATGDSTSATIAPKPKRPRPRKKPITLLPNLNLGSSDSMTPEMMSITLQNTMDPSSSTPHAADASNIISSAGPPTNLTPLGGVPIKKKRVYKNRRSLFKLCSVPKPLPVPTVFVKSPALQHVNGPTPSTSTSEKDKAPSLKVIGGKAVFYRGEKEELDVEPITSKPRGQIQFDPEVPWLCCFCNLGPHTQKLGDLFGPYYTEQIKGSGKSKSATKVETWMHQDCALWAGSVVLIGSKLHGLEDTLSHSTKDSCTTCGNKGATIGCLKRGCKQAVHFPCAVRKSWKLDQETFHSFCPAHIP